MTSFVVPCMETVGTNAHLFGPCNDMMGTNEPCFVLCIDMIGICDKIFFSINRNYGD